MTKNDKPIEIEETELDSANGGYLETLADVDISGIKASKPKRRKGYMFGGEGDAF